MSKEQIVEVALQEFLKNGIQSFTIKQLTDITKVSTKTVYKLFADKRALLRDCLNKHYHDLFIELSVLNTGSENEIDAFLKIIHRTVELEFEVNPLFYSELNKYYPGLQSEVSNAQGELLGFLTNIIEQGKKSGVFLPEINREVFWITFQQLYMGITRKQLYRNLNLSGPELVRNTVMIYLRGICTLNGLQKSQLSNLSNL